jgi:hypothetical protein
MRKACLSGVAALFLAFGPNGADAMALREEGPSAHAPPSGSPSAPTQEGLAASIGGIRSTGACFRGGRTKSMTDAFSGTSAS